MYKPCKCGTDTEFEFVTRPFCSVNISFFLVSYEKNLLDTQWTRIDNDGGVHAGKTKDEIETLIASIHISFYILQEKVAKSEEKIGGQGGGRVEVTITV